jgi:hypothetical protein
LTTSNRLSIAREFAEGRTLARVSLDDFKIHLQEARAEVDSISPLLTDRRLAGECGMRWLRFAMAPFGGNESISRAS